jgi:hypothetical protein
MKQSLLLMLAISSMFTANVMAQKKNSLKPRIQKTLANTPALPAFLAQQLMKAKDADLVKLLTHTTNQYGSLLTPEQTEELNEIRKAQIKALKQLKLNGIAIAVDPTAALIYGNQNPTFTMQYTDGSGKTRNRSFEASIISWGVQFELSIRLDAIIFTEASRHTFFDSDKQINLGMGISLCADAGVGVGLIYVPFLNAPGGMVIVSAQLGIGGNLAVITGGYLRPLPIE